MAMNASKTQIDRLGERLKKGDITEDDLRLLDAYRRSLADAYDEVVGAVRKELGLEPTGRPAKSTTSIAEKLRRESIRLTQIQDIAGCRLIVPDIANQDQVVQSLSRLFGNTNIVDRRQKPSHGYRAVHVVVTHLGKMVEIQVRTSFQHLWAELSEKFSDVAGAAIKYGGGDKIIQEALTATSSLISDVESLEMMLADGAAQLFATGITQDEEQKLAEIRAQLNSLRQELFDGLRKSIKRVEDVKGGK
jgi:putative GTP pyrophosphokinase